MGKLLDQIEQKRRENLADAEQTYVELVIAGDSAPEGAADELASLMEVLGKSREQVARDIQMTTEMRQTIELAATQGEVVAAERAANEAFAAARETLGSRIKALENELGALRGEKIRRHDDASAAREAGNRLRTWRAVRSAILAKIEGMMPEQVNRIAEYEAGEARLVEERQATAEMIERRQRDERDAREAQAALASHAAAIENNDRRYYKPGTPPAGTGDASVLAPAVPPPASDDDTSPRPPR